MLRPGLELQQVNGLLEFSLHLGQFVGIFCLTGYQVGWFLFNACVRYVWIEWSVFLNGLGQVLNGF